MHSTLRVFGTSIRVILLAWLVVHFATTALYCFPSNPLKASVSPFLFREFGTYFSQNWSLFAPNPIQNNQTLLVMCLTDRNGSDGDAADLPKEGWEDITMPLFHRHQENRFSAYDRISRTHTNFIKAYLTGGGALQPLADACRRGDKEACKLGESQLAAMRSRAVATLVKVASSYCAYTPEGPEIRRVALRVRDTPVAPWSQREAAGERKAKDINLGVFSLDRNVAPSGVLKEGA